MNSPHCQVKNRKGKRISLIKKKEEGSLHHYPSSVESLHRASEVAPLMLSFRKGTSWLVPGFFGLVFLIWPSQITSGSVRRWRGWGGGTQREGIICKSREVNGLQKLCSFIISSLPCKWDQGLCPCLPSCWTEKTFCKNEGEYQLWISKAVFRRWGEKAKPKCPLCHAASQHVPGGFVSETGPPPSLITSWPPTAYAQ